MKKHEATEEELRSVWKDVEDYWGSQSKDNLLDYPWTHTRFHLEIFKITLRQRGWKVPMMLGGPF